jgi:Dynamitin
VLSISALQFSKALAQLDAVQQKLEISLGNGSKLLMETQSKFAENVEHIQKNFETLDQRLAAIKK